MPGKRPNEPIGPTNVPGQALDPKIYEDEPEATDDEPAESEESEPEQQARESEQAFGKAATRTPPG